MTVNSLLLYDSLGFASNVLSLINGFKVAEYLTHIHGNSPKIEWFLDNVSKLNSISGFIGVVASIIDGYGVYQQTGSSSKGVFTIAYDIGGYGVIILFRVFNWGIGFRTSRCYSRDFSNYEH